MTKRIVLLALLFTALAACGNKGPLVMPDKKPAPTPVAPKDTPPTDTHPAAPQSGAHTSQA